MAADAAFVVSRRTEVLLEQIVGSGQILKVVTMEQPGAIVVSDFYEVVDGWHQGPKRRFGIRHALEHTHELPPYTAAIQLIVI